MKDSRKYPVDDREWQMWVTALIGLFLTICVAVAFFGGIAALASR